MKIVYHGKSATRKVFKRKKFNMKRVHKSYNMKTVQQ